MAVLTFDTLKFANRLKAAGVPDKQAEAEALSEVLEVNFKELATKQDLKQLETELKEEIKHLETEIKGKLRLLKWMLGFLLAGVAALILKVFFAAGL